MSDKVLGVLGGMGPLASAEFLKILAENVPASRDQDHPRVIYLSDPKIPDRSDAILHGKEDPTPYLKEDLLKLVEWGSDLLAVPCNTAHYFIESFATDLPVPLVSIVEASVKLASEVSQDGSWLLSTKATWKSGIYVQVAKIHGYPLLLPSEQIMDDTQSVIRLVKAGMVERAGKLLKSILNDLWRKRDLPFIAACTELPLAYYRTGFSTSRMISSLEALAVDCIDRLFEK